MKTKLSLTLITATTIFLLQTLVVDCSADLSLAEKIRLEADYLVACQYFNPGDAAHGAINDIYGYPTWIVPRENGMAILGLLLAAETLQDTNYRDRANISMDFLVSIQEEDGAWCDQYIRRTEDGQVVEVALSKSPTHAAEVMMAMYMLGYREDRYPSMKLAAQYLFECQNNGYNGLIVGGKKSDGTFYDWNWITDNSYAYCALVAARGWALVKGEISFAQQCADATQEILNGINIYFYKGPDWWTVVDNTGRQFYYDFDVEGRISWMNFAPQFLDLPASGVGNPAVGDWIHNNLQQESGGCIWGGAYPEREYPGISFQSAFCWFDFEDQIDRANAAVNWAENSGLWQLIEDSNGVKGGWIDWININYPYAREEWWYRFIDTSFYSIACWLGGYDFTVFNNLPPQLEAIGNKTVTVGDTLTFRISATDSEYDVLKFTASNLPPGATFNTLTHTFRWTPTSAQAGQYPNVKFKASDKFLYDSESIVITVRKTQPCFLAGTPILMSDGSTKPIEKIKVGDIILAYDVEKAKIAQDKVREVFVHDTDNYLIINEELKVTGNHLVYSDGKWVEIGQLKIGDKILKQDGQYAPIKTVQKIQSNEKVYNFEVNPYHTYIANGYVAHNRKPIPVITSLDQN